MYDDYEPAELATTTTPIALAEHRCVECRATIRPGEKYERVRGKWWGAFRTMTTCMACAALRKRVNEAAEAEGCGDEFSTPPFGGLIQAARDWGLIEGPRERKA